MIRAVINFDMESLFTALTQDAAILVFMAVVAVLLWFNAGYVKSEVNIDIYEGLFIKRKHSILLKSLAVVETVRPLSFRIFGASKVILYFKTNKIGKTTTLYLSKKDAEAFA
ncbi:MAG: PH domain-containing protein, partial [Oscillospiraceae bacterium]